jgi:hypothetical protein
MRRQVCNVVLGEEAVFEQPVCRFLEPILLFEQPGSNISMYAHVRLLVVVIIGEKLAESHCRICGLQR